MAWINVEDKLPEVNEVIDVYMNTGRRLTDITFRSDGKFHWFTKGRSVTLNRLNLTHWMKVPEGPKK